MKNEQNYAILCKKYNIMPSSNAKIVFDVNLIKE